MNSRQIIVSIVIIAGKFNEIFTMEVDKIQVGKWCWQKLNPHKVPQFDNLNTEGRE